MFPRHEILGSGLSQDSKRPPGPLLVAHFLAHTLLVEGKDLSHAAPAFHASRFRVGFDSCILDFQPRLTDDTFRFTAPPGADQVEILPPQQGMVDTETEP